MGTSILNFGKKNNLASLIAVAISAYVFGAVTSPLDFLKSDNPPVISGQVPAPVVKEVPLVISGKVPAPVMKEVPLVISAQVVKEVPKTIACELPLTDGSSKDLLLFRTKCGNSVPSESVREILLAKLFDGVSPFEGFPPEYAKLWLKEAMVTGWGSQATVFERLMREVNPRIVLELGSFLGASAIHIATLAKDLGLKTLILCGDDFRGWPGFRYTYKLKLANGDVQLLHQFMMNVVSMNFTESILPLPFSTSSVISSLCEWGVYADLIEVDASHDFHSAWADINGAYAILRPGGVMFGHDYFNGNDNRGVQRAVDLFAKIKGLRVEPDGEHWILRSK